MIHELKCKPKYFKLVTSGEKTFEYRRNDRSFKVGDFLALNEYDDVSGYSGNCCLVEVTYVFKDTQYVTKDYVVMSIRPCCIGTATESMLLRGNDLFIVPTYGRTEGEICKK